MNISGTNLFFSSSSFFLFFFSVTTTLSPGSGHARRCNDTEKAYCVNGGECYFIHGINQLSCKWVISCALEFALKMSFSVVNLSSSGDSLSRGLNVNSFSWHFYCCNVPQRPDYKFLSCCLFSWSHLISILLSFSSSSSNTSQGNAASLPNYPPVVYFKTNNGVRCLCAHPFKSCLVYRRAAH